MSDYEEKPKEPDYCYDPLDKYRIDPTKCYAQKDWDAYYEWRNKCEDRKKE